MQFKKDNKCIIYILKALHLNSKNKGIKKESVCLINVDKKLS